MNAEIVRTDSNDKRTFGSLMIDGEKFCDTLERPWMENQNNVSCIPKGIYKVIKHKSDHLGDVYWFQDVPGRTMIYIHSGNFVDQILGCCLVGERNKECLVNSKNALEKLLEKNIDQIKII